MKKIAILITIGFFLIAPVMTAAGGAERSFNGNRSSTPAKNEYVPNQIIVKFMDNPSTKAKLTTLNQEADKSQGKISTGSNSALTSLLPGLDVKGASKVFTGKAPQKRLIEQKLYQLNAKVKVKKAKDILDEKRLTRLLSAEANEKKFGLDRVCIIDVDNGDILPIIERLRQDPNIEYAEPNYIYKISSVPMPAKPYRPNDHYVENPDLYEPVTGTHYWRDGSWGQTYPDMWGLEKIGAVEAWNLFDTNQNGVFDAGETKPGEGIIVAVIDTGVDYTHEDLAANIWQNDDPPGDSDGDGDADDDGNGYVDDYRGYDFVSNDNDPMDDNGHGTHTSGTIAAVGGNYIGVIGVAPYAKIMAVKGLDSSGGGTIQNLANAVRYAADSGADILSNSWGGGGSSQPIQEAFAFAYSQGCINVAAAGNENMDAVFSEPANIENVIAVAATDNNDVRAWFSNWGSKIDVSAPGVDVLSTYLSGIASSEKAIVTVNSDSGRKLQGNTFAFSAPFPAGGLYAEVAPAGLGYPEDFAAADFNGKIALIARGELYFSEKVENAYNAGAVGAIIYNNEPGNFNGTLQALSGIPALSLSMADGVYLRDLVLAQSGIGLAAYVTMSAVDLGNFTAIDGTSMACPHVAGLAALIKSAHPADTQGEVRARILAGAESIDLSNPAFMGRLGAGRINAHDSLTALPSPILKLVSVVKNNVFPGGTGAMTAYIKNYWEPAEGVTAELETSDSRVTIVSGTASLGDIGTGQTAANAGNPFVIILDPSVQYGDNIALQLHLEGGNGYSYTQNLIMSVNFFENVGPLTNLPLVDHIPFFVNSADYNNDGYADALIVGNAQSALYKNLGNGSFGYANSEAGIVSPESPWASMFFDSDNDGDKDLWMTGWPSRFYLNNGDGTFSDITASSAGLEQYICFGGATVDYDNDGFTDIIGQTEGVYALHNNGDNTFTDTTREAGLEGISCHFTSWILPLDFDNDGRQDICISAVACGSSGYLTTLYKGILYRNTESGRFEKALEFESPSALSAAAAGDYNNDGYIDILFTSSGSGPAFLYRNNGDGSFTDVTAESGDIAFTPGGYLFTGTDFFDYDNDGNLDLYAISCDDTNPDMQTHMLYHNNGDGTFTNVTSTAFPGDIAVKWASAGIFDYDNDGALDIYAPGSSYGPKGGFLRNMIGRTNHWLKIKLEGRAVNRDAIACRVAVKKGSDTRVREVHTGSVENNPLHFGLGSWTVADEIEIRWPDGNVQKIFNVPLDQCLYIVEPPALKPLPDRTVKFGEPIGFTVEAYGRPQDRLTYYAHVDDGLLPDICIDGAIDHNDIEAIRALFGKHSGQPGYNAAADMDANGIIEENDISIFISGLNNAGIRLNGASFRQDTREFSWTPPQAAVGTHDITFIVLDEEYFGDSETISIKVSGQHPPSIGSATLSPSPAYFNSTLTASYTDWFDAEGAPPQAVYDWYVNGAKVNEAHADTFNCSGLSHFTAIYCVITPYDGVDYGMPRETNRVVIENIAPSIDSAVISGHNQPLTADYVNWQDPDDTLRAPKYEWHAGNRLVCMDRVLPVDTNFQREDVYCIITPFDGTDYGAPKESNHITIPSDGAPQINAAVIEFSPGENNLVAQYINWYDYDGPYNADGSIIMIPIYRWYINGERLPMPMGSAGSPTLPIAFLSTGDTVYCAIQPFDSIMYGIPKNSESIVISPDGNTPPHIDAAAVSPNQASTMTTLTASCTGWQDPDGPYNPDGTVKRNPVYDWYVNGSIRLRDPGDPLPVHRFSCAGLGIGDIVYCVITPNDGIDSGEPAETNHVEVIPNAPPSIDYASISSSTQDPYMTSTFSVHYSQWQDIDGPAVNPLYQWYVNGAAVTGADSDRFSRGIYPHPDLQRGDDIYCVITPDDTISSGEPKTSNHIVIGNIPPYIPAANISPTIAYSSTILTASYTGWNDPDGPAVNPLYQWYVNSAPAAGATADTFDCSSASAGDKVRCDITPNDTISSGGYKSSNSVTIQQLPDTLVVDDYTDTVSDKNTLGLWTGGSPNDANFSMIEVNSAREFAYDCSAAGSGYWYASNLWNDVNFLSVAPYEYLSFRVRGASGGEDFYIQLISGNDGVPVELHSSGYFTVEKGWKRVSIPLSAFEGLDKNRMRAIAVVFRNGMTNSQSTIWLDDLAFSRFNSNVLVIDDYADSNPGKNAMQLWSGGSPNQSSFYMYEWEHTNKISYNCFAAGSSYWYASCVWDNTVTFNGSDFEYLSFRVKGETGGEDFYIELQYGSSPGPTQSMQVHSSDYFTVTAGWQEVRVPLRAFSGLDKANLRAVAFVFNDTIAKKQGTVYLDDISLSYFVADARLINDYNDSDEGLNSIELAEKNNADRVRLSVSEIPLHAYGGGSNVNKAKQFTYNLDTPDLGDNIFWHSSSLWDGDAYLNASDFDYLSFRVKGETGGEDFYVQLQYDNPSTNSFVPIQTVNYSAGNQNPAFCDIDDDGLADFFTGDSNGRIIYYRNTGTVSAPAWERITDNYNGIDVGYDSVPAFCDIDADGDYDMFTGCLAGPVTFYKNEGTPAAPVWGPAVFNYTGVTGLPTYSAPAFCDIDSDGDYDLFVGRGDGKISYYENCGNAAEPHFELREPYYGGIDPGTYNRPVFCDIDSDGDYDLFVGGGAASHIAYYRNDGTAAAPIWVLVTGDYADIDGDIYGKPAFCDIDSDGDYDFLISFAISYAVPNIVLFKNNSNLLYYGSYPLSEVHSSDYFSVTHEWQEANIPLAAFGAIDKTKLRSVAIIFRDSLDVTAGTIYIDNLSFTRGYDGKAHSTGLIRVDRDTKELLVDNVPFTVRGVGYQPTAIGSMYTYPDDNHIYDRDFPLLRDAGCNTIKTWGRPGPNLMAKAAEYGLRVIANFWIDYNADLADPDVRRDIKESFTAFVNDLKASPSLLMWSIGNENNYHNGSNPAYYKFVNELAEIAFWEERSSYHPVMLVNGGLADIGEYEKGAEDMELNFVDIWGSNIYTERFDNIEWCGGRENLFDLYAEKSSKPLILTGYGADAFKTTSLDPFAGAVNEGEQAAWIGQNAAEIRIAAAAGKCIGGIVTEYSDEWCKGAGGSASAHDSGGYSVLPSGDMLPDSFANEEYWGIVETAPDGTWQSADGWDDVRPRQAYQILREIWALDTFPPEARFTSSATVGWAPLEISFINCSTGIIAERLWDFGDGQTSSAQNPVHTYSAIGAYTVTLTVTGPQGSDTEIKTDYINVLPPPPVPDFMASPTSGVAPLDVNFTDLSTGAITTWFWDFGDSFTSREQNPIHTYEASGTYTVSLTITGPGGKSGRSISNCVSVAQDFTPPAMIITSPPHLKRCVSGANLLIEGSVTDDYSEINTITISTGPFVIPMGIAIQVPVIGGRFSYTLTGLQEPEQEIRISACDRAGNRAQVEFTDTVDTTPPAVTITSPEDGSLVDGGTVTVEGYIEENTGPARITVNGDEVDFEVQDPYFVFSHQISGLTPGLHQILVAVEDMGGNSTESSVTIRVPIAVNEGDSIQAAVDLAQDGDIILMAAGVYTLPADIVIDNKAVTLKGNNAYSTVIDAGAADNAFVIEGGSDVTLENISIKNAGSAGIDIRENSTMATILNCVISDNSRGGICASMGADLTLLNTIVHHNNRAGVEITDAGTTATIVNNVIAHNQGEGGIKIFDGAAATVNNNIIAYNREYWGIWSFNNPGTPACAITMNNNDSFGNYPSAYNDGEVFNYSPALAVTSSNISLEPDFINAAASNYSLEYDSILLRKGMGIMPIYEEYAAGPQRLDRQKVPILAVMPDDTLLIYHYDSNGNLEGTVRALTVGDDLLNGSPLNAGIPRPKYTSLQEAITNAVNGDIILVSAGTYPETIKIENKSLRIIGEGEDKTVINAQDLKYGFHISNNTDVTLANIAVTNALNYNIYIGPWSYYTTTIVRLNHVLLEGSNYGIGGVLMNGPDVYHPVCSYVTIDNSKIRYATKTGIELGFDTFRYQTLNENIQRPQYDISIHNTELTNNQRAISVSGYRRSIEITHSVIANNYSGGGIRLYSDGNPYNLLKAYLNYNIISNNTGYGLWLGPTAQAYLNDNVLYSNTQGSIYQYSYNTLHPYIENIEPIDKDPKFIDTSIREYGLRIDSPALKLNTSTLDEDCGLVR